MNEPARRCWVEIDLAALERNVKRLRTELPAWLRFISVVKADAYGHGLKACAERLMHGGADIFAVANREEAEALRERGQGWPTLILGPLLPGEERDLPSEVIPVVSSLEEIIALGWEGARQRRVLAVQLMIDTGMSRAGLLPEDAPRAFAHIEEHPHLRLDGLCTHFADADNDDAFTEEQRRCFLEALRTLPARRPAPLLVHADNSAGLASFAPDGVFNAVRIGLSQWGVAPQPNRTAPASLTPVLSFHAQVGLVKKLPAGRSVSYGRTWTTPGPTRVAVLTAGYGDGLPLALGNRGAALLHGHRCPIRGRVTMDQTIVEVPSELSVRPGDTATFIGAQEGDRLTAEEVARTGATIPWQLLCAITKRVHRLYRGS